MNSNSNFKNFKQTVQNTRAIRRFKQNIVVKDDDLVEIIDLVRTTSSSKNMQPLKYIVVTDEVKKQCVYKPLKWAAHLSNWDQSEDEKPSAYILIVNDTSIDGVALIDAGIALQTIMLGLSSIGLNGCPLASIDKAAYKKLFKLSDNLEPFLIIAIGKSEEDITIVDAKEDTNYYRDEKQNHFVPKRILEDVLIATK
jgi:nitroreductase